jgi:hypothetical protein
MIQSVTRALEENAGGSGSGAGETVRLIKHLARNVELAFNHEVVRAIEIQLKR